MSDKVSIRRLPTGVPGLDAVLGGGVPEFSFNVIAGTPGAGKTTLVQQILFALVRVAASRASLPCSKGARANTHTPAPLVSIRPPATARRISGSVRTA